MLNNLIKLFYSDVVKVQMGNMPKEEYELRGKFKDLHNLTLKIDSVFFKGFKILLGLFILYLAFSVKLFLGIGVLLVESVYVVYKMNYERKVKEAIINVKNNVEISKEQFLNEDSKKGINLLITLLVISIMTGFNYFIAVSFILVLIYTIRSIYSVHKEN